MKIGRSAKSGRFVTITSASAQKKPTTHVVESDSARPPFGAGRASSTTLRDDRTGQTYGLKGYGGLRGETKLKKGLDPAKPVSEQVRK